MCRRDLIAFALAGIAIGAPATHSATFCVADGTALQNALNSANSNSESDTINMQAGTYLAPANGFSYHNTGSYSLDLEGGWNAGCITQTPDASLTVLDGQSQSIVLTASDFADPGGDLTIRYVSFLHGTSAGGSAALGAVAPGAVRIENCRFRLNNADAATATSGIIHTGTVRGPLYFINNVVANNSALGSDSVLQFDLNVGASTGVLFYINGNTVADNTYDSAAPISGTVFLRPDALGSLANNILWNNAGVEFLQNITIQPQLLNNDIDVLNVTPAAGSGGNLAVDPQFISATNHHLQATTPLFNAGFAAPPGGSSGYDLDGNLRIAFGAMDIGAYELQTEPDLIFVDGFDGS
jgi:hypothetical protein